MPQRFNTFEHNSFWNKLSGGKIKKVLLQMFWKTEFIWSDFVCIRSSVKKLWIVRTYEMREYRNIFTAVN